MGRSKHKSGQQESGKQNSEIRTEFLIPNQHPNNRDRSKARSPTPESEEEHERITVSRYGEKNDENVFTFRLLQLITQDNTICNDFFAGPHPIGFPGGQYYIAVKELVIEWEDYQNEYCGYVECLQCEWEVLKNMNSEGKWVNCIQGYIDLNKDKQLLRFAKPPGIKNTFIHIPNEEEAYYGLDLPLTVRGCLRGNGLQHELHEIQCAIKPMFDESEVLPIKYAHITVVIMIGNK